MKTLFTVYVHYPIMTIWVSMVTQLLCCSLTGGLGVAWLKLSATQAVMWLVICSAHKASCTWHEESGLLWGRYLNAQQCCVHWSMQAQCCDWLRKAQLSVWEFRGFWWFYLYCTGLFPCYWFWFEKHHKHWIKSMPTSNVDKINNGRVVHI